MKTAKTTKACLEDLRTQLQRAIDAVTETHGFKVKAEVQRGRYGEGYVDYTVHIGAVGDNGLVASRESEDFAELAPLYGLEPEHLGASFEMRGHTYTVVGINARASKMPVNCRRDDGKSFKFAAAQVKRSLGFAALMKKAGAR